MPTYYVLSPELQQRQMGQWTAFYHRQWGGLCLLDDDARDLLLEFSSPKEIADRDASGLGRTAKGTSPEARLLRQMMLRRFLVTAEADASGTARAVESSAPPVAAPASKVNVVQLVLVNACNFGCTYCFEGVQGSELVRQSERNPGLIQLKKPSRAGDAPPAEVKVNLHDSVYASSARLEHQADPENRLMSEDDAVLYVAKAIAVAKSTGTTRLMIQFFGGEPLMNWNAVLAVLQTYGDGHNHGIDLDYTIVTNGSLIREEIARAFHDYGVGVCVSFDSVKSSSRPLKNGKDSRPVVLKGIRMLQQHGVRIAINAALSSDTWDHFDADLVDFAVENGAGEIGVVVDLDPGFYSKYGSTAITDKLWEVVEAGRQRGVVVTGYWHQIFQLLSGFAVVPQRGFKNCSAKGAQLSIEPNGSVFSCKAGSGHFGSIHDADLLSSPVYRQHADLRQNNPAFCHGCEIEGFCAGLCLGPLEKKYGAVDSVEPAACDFYRRITRKFIAAQEPFEVATFDLGSARARAQV
jgi:uncharacterized protein